MAAVDKNLAEENRRRRAAGYFRMEDFRIDFASNVDRPAQEPAVGLFLKRNDYDTNSGADPLQHVPTDGESRIDYVKRLMVDAVVAKIRPNVTDRFAFALMSFEQAQAEARFDEAQNLEGVAKLDVDKSRDSVPVMTSVEDGHQHLLWLGSDRGGSTNWATSDGADKGHDHAWLIDENGSLTIGEDSGHTHTVEASSILAAMRDMLTGCHVPDVAVDVIFASADGEPLEDVEKRDLHELIEAIDTGEVIVQTKKAGRILNSASLPNGTFAIRNSVDLRNAIIAVDAEGDHHRAARSHIVKRARAIGMEDQLPGALVKAVAKNVAALVGDASSTQKANMDPKDKNDVAKDDRIKQLETELATQKAVAELPANQRAHYDALEDSAKAEFLSKSAEQRQTVVESIEKGNPVLHVCKDGTEIRKEDGPLVLKMAKQLDAQAEQLAAASIEKAEVGFRKQANTDLSNFKGTLDARAKLVKAVASLPTEEQTEVFELLKGTNEAAADIFQRRGISLLNDDGGVSKGAGTAASAEAELNGLAKKHADTHGVDFYTAYEAVSLSNPSLAKRAIGHARQSNAEGTQ